MIIDNPDALIQWLTGYLPPLCDADPVVLAKYCFALVKKDRPEAELKASLIEQLDVFLKSNTENFVEKLLEVARNKSYIPKSTTPAVKSSATSSDDVVKPATPESAPDNETTSPNGAAPENETTSTNGAAPTSSSTTEPKDDTTETAQPPLPDAPPPERSVPHPPPETAPPLPSSKGEPSLPAKGKKVETERADERRGRRSSRAKDKSRSRSRERDRRRSRSRGRSTRSKYDDRRRRSPHLKRFSRRSRSPRWSGSPGRRSRSRERRSRSRNRSPRSPKRHNNRSHSPNGLARTEASPSPSSMRKSPAKKEKERSASPDSRKESSSVLQSVISIPPSSSDRYSSSSSKSQRCRDYDEQGFCMRGDQCPFDHGADPVVLEGGALDFPPPLAGVPPINSAGVTYPIPAPPLPQDIPGRPFTRPPPPRAANQFREYTPNNPNLWGSGDAVPPPPFYTGRGQQRIISVPPPRFTAPPPPIGAQDINRELISVPVNGCGPGTQKGIRVSLAQRLGPAPAQSIPVAPPGGFQLTHGSKYAGAPENCTLELRKIPSGMNTILHLNQHFSKFGDITNIQVQHEGDPEAALVTFLTHSEANASYRSTEAVLNNRFIKLFWHNASKGEVPSSTTNVHRNIHDRMRMRNPNKSLIKRSNAQSDSSVSSNTGKVLITKGGMIKTVYNTSALQSTEEPMEDGAVESSAKKVKTSTAADSTQQKLTSVELKKLEIEAIRKQQELLKAELLAKQKLEKQKAEALKLKNEVENRAKQLLKEQMQHVKLLINKLEKNKSTMKPDEIKVLFQTIKSLQGAIETTKSRLASSVTPATTATAPASAPKKTRAQLEKEILDTELELYTLQSDGVNFQSVKTRLDELKSQAAQRNFGLKPFKSFAAPIHPPTSSRGFIAGRTLSRGTLRGGRGRLRGIRRYGPSLSAAAVDRRTTSLNASGFEREDKIQVLAHFSALGSISSYSWDDLTPAVTIHYGTRKEAERAMAEGRNLGDRLLTLTWVSDAAAAPGFESSSLQLQSSHAGGGLPQHVRRRTSPYASRSSSVSSLVPPHHDDEEEIIEEEIVEIETEDFEEGFEDVEEEEEEEECEEGTRSWRR